MKVKGDGKKGAKLGMRKGPYNVMFLGLHNRSTQTKRGGNQMKGKGKRDGERRKNLPDMSLWGEKRPEGDNTLRGMNHHKASRKNWKNVIEGGKERGKGGINVDERWSRSSGIVRKKPSGRLKKKKMETSGRKKR